MGELHLDVVLERVRRKARIAVTVGAPQVAYRETIHGPAVEVEGKLSKQNGGNGQYARVVLRVEPSEAAFAFDNTIKGGAVPAAFIPSVEKVVRQAIAHGPLGYPVTGVKVTLLDGDFHAVDSSDMAFMIAAKHATLAGLKRANPRARNRKENLVIITTPFKDERTAAMADTTRTSGANARHCA